MSTEPKQLLKKKERALCCSTLRRRAPMTVALAHNPQKIPNVVANEEELMALARAMSGRGS